jgi:hypothetical protein
LATCFNGIIWIEGAENRALRIISGDDRGGKTPLCSGSLIVAVMKEFLMMAQ